MIPRCVLVLALASTLAACSSSAPAKKPAAHPSSSQYRPGPADDAAVIASHIPGCTGAAAGDIGGGAPYVTSTATCTLEGHVMTVDVWSSASVARSALTLVSAPAHLTYAFAARWTSFAGEDGIGASTQRLLAHVVARALGGTTATT